MFSGPCAAGNREPSQVRKEAALSGPSRAPQSRRLNVSAPSIFPVFCDRTDLSRVGFTHKNIRCGSVFVEKSAIDEAKEAHAPDHAEAQRTLGEKLLGLGKLVEALM